MKKAPPDYRAVAGERHSGATVWGPLFFFPTLALSGWRNRRIRGLVVVAVAAVVTRRPGTVCASTGKASEVADYGAYALVRDSATFNLFTVRDEVHTRRLQFTRH